MKVISQNDVIFCKVCVDALQSHLSDDAEFVIKNGVFFGCYLPGFVN